MNQSEKPQDAVNEASKFFDNSLAQAPVQRSRRLFKFHEEGRFEQLAQRIRAKVADHKMGSSLLT